MAQQARPHWYTQREYLRLTLSSAVSGFGSLPFSTSPMSSSLPCSSDPTQQSLAPGVEEAQSEDEDEDGHLDEAEHAVGLESGGPREDEHCLHVEEHEHEGEHVVPDVRLAPAVALRVDAALVVHDLLDGGSLRAEQAAEPDEDADQHDGEAAEDNDHQPVSEELGHEG